MKTLVPYGKSQALLHAALFCMVLVLFFLYVFRPWYNTWGATAVEVAATLPGDDLVPEPKMITTRAVTIHAPAERVWPWLVQVGYRRAGWYNYDWINRLMGVADFVDGHRSANRIIPELQKLKAGDVILLAPTAGWTVAAIEPRRSLSLSARIDFETGRPFKPEERLPDKYLNSSQTFILEPIDERTTRFVVRDRLAFGMGRAEILTWLLEPGFFIQESAFMRGVKSRAEAVEQAAGGR